MQKKLKIIGEKKSRASPTPQNTPTTKYNPG